MANTLERGHTRVRGFNDAEMDFQLIRQLGASRYGGASVGECLALASQIEDANPASWVQAFERAAHRQLQDAIHRNERGHLISARDQYLVACNNFRAAEYYTPIDAPSHRTLGLASREAFLHAMHCAGLVCERWWFEINNETLPAYYIHRPNQVAERILAIVSGFDGTLEESCLMYGAPALERGFDVLCFSGPGQMDSWRFNETSHFRPDFEVIGHQVIERLLGLDSNTDSKQIALMGISFGGYFATRIATHEPRFNALIANSPILDLHAYMTSFVGLDPAELSDDDNFSPDDLQHIPDHVMDKQKRAMAANLIKRFGQATFRDTYRYLRNFRIDLKALSQIHLPCLGLVGEAEGDQPLSQAIEFVQRIGANASLHVFTAQEGADGHCQSANPAFSAAVSMDWLEEVLPNDG